MTDISRPIEDGQSKNSTALASRQIHPRPNVRLLGRPQHFGTRPLRRIYLIQRIPIVQPAVLHHVPNGVRVANILKRVAIQDYQICHLPHLDRPDVLLQPDPLGAEDRRAPEHIERRHPALRDRPHLPMVAESIELTMAADADSSTGFHDVARGLRDARKVVLVVHEPAAGVAAAEAAADAAA